MDANDVESVCGAAPSVRVTQKHFHSYDEESSDNNHNAYLAKVNNFGSWTSTSARTLSTGSRTSTRKTSLPALSGMKRVLVQ